MSYTITTKGTGDKAVKSFNTHCNHAGCKAVVTSAEGKGASWQSARKSGWFSDSAANHRCPIHRPSALRKQTLEVKRMAKAVAEPVSKKVAKKVAEIKNGKATKSGKVAKARNGKKTVK